MRWVDAVPSSAEVINSEVVRDRPNEEFIGMSMSTNIACAMDTERSVSISIKPPYPRPAHLLPKSLRSGPEQLLMGWANILRVSVAIAAHVVHAAQALCDDSLRATFDRAHDFTIIARRRAPW